MENKNKLLWVLFIFLFLLYISSFVFVVAVYIAPSVRKNKKEELQEDISDDNSFKGNSSQTEFYKKSSEYAKSVLLGKEFESQYGEANYYGNKLLDVINTLNNETKNSIIIVMRYFSVEPVQARDNEKLFRAMSQQENVPLWFIILREATRRVLPETMKEPINNMSESNKIVPLYQRTG